MIFMRVLISTLDRKNRKLSLHSSGKNSKLGISILIPIKKSHVIFICIVEEKLTLFLQDCISEKIDPTFDDRVPTSIKFK